MKRNEIRKQFETTPEGTYQFKIISVEDCDAIKLPNKVVVRGMLSTGKQEAVYMTTTKGTNDVCSIYDAMICDIAEQCLAEDVDFDTDDRVQMDVLLKGQTVTAYVVHTDNPADGKTYANLQFRKNKKVQAMLDMM